MEKEQLKQNTWQNLADSLPDKDTLCVVYYVGKEAISLYQRMGGSLCNVPKEERCQYWWVYSPSVNGHKHAILQRLDDYLSKVTDEQIKADWEALKQYSQGDEGVCVDTAASTGGNIELDLAEPVKNEQAL